MQVRAGSLHRARAVVVLLLECRSECFLEMDPELESNYSAYSHYPCRQRERLPDRSLPIPMGIALKSVIDRVGSVPATTLERSDSQLLWQTKKLSKERSVSG